MWWLNRLPVLRLSCRRKIAVRLSTLMALISSLLGRWLPTFAAGDPPNPIWVRVSATAMKSSGAKQARLERNKGTGKWLIKVEKQKLYPGIADSAGPAPEWKG